MATATGPSASGKALPVTHLGEDDLGTLYESLYPVLKRYKPFALQIKVKINEIDRIEAQYVYPSDKLLEILRVRLKATPALTWTDIYKALRSQTVGEYKLADSIEQVRSGPSFERTRTLDQEPKRKYERRKKSSKREKYSRGSRPMHQIETGEPNSDEELSDESRYTKHTKKTQRGDMASSASSDEIGTSYDNAGVKGYYNSAMKRGQRKGNTTGQERAKASATYAGETFKRLPAKKTAKIEKSVIHKTSYYGVTQKGKTKEMKREPESESSSEDEMLSLPFHCIAGMNIRPKSAANIEPTEKKKHIQAAATQRQSGEKIKEKCSHKLKRFQERRTESESGVSSTTSSEKEPIVANTHNVHALAKQAKQKAGKNISLAISVQKSGGKLSSHYDKHERERAHKKARALPTEEADPVLCITPFSYGTTADKDSEITEKEATQSDNDSSATSENKVTKVSLKSGKSKCTDVDMKKKPDSPRGHFKIKTQDDCNIPQKKRSKGRKREGNMSSLARVSSLSSVSEEEKQKQLRSGRHRRAIRKSHYKRKKKSELRKQGENISSEPDDSSPEYDGPIEISRNEIKELRRAFNCFFGKLCCVIKDPVNTAAELQGVHILSCSTMEYIIRSHESRQINAITLVRALQNKIRSHPNRIFTIIKCFMCNDDLLQIGREMWSATGKVCPEITAALFGTELPPTERQLSIQPTGLVLPVEDLSPSISPGKEGLGSQLQKVSKSVFKPCQPVLKQYGEYLRSCYRARPLAAADKYLPTLNVPYINLAIVSREDSDPKERNEFTRQTLHGGVDQILKNKMPINIEHMLTPDCSEIPVRFVLVEGPPGIGKSTFAWEVCRRWDEIEGLRNYHVVVLLKLRGKWVLNAAKPSDLFRYPPEPELSQNIYKALNELHGKSLLFVFDGFDEVSHSFHEDSVIKSILCRQLLPECTIILTTRPSAKSILESISQPQVDKHLEIIGFTEEERVRYITKVFKKEPELQSNFLKYMFLVPHIKSMMYIPLNCAIIAQVYYESQSSCHLAIPRTRTQLYQAVTHSILVRHMKMKDNYREYTSVLPEGLKHKDMKMFKNLARFAFDSYHELKSKKVTFFREDIPQGLVHFGFMNESTEMYASKGVERTFSFLHLSLQEYLAAWHITSTYSIGFQMAYHWLTLKYDRDSTYIYRGNSKEEEALISSLEPLGKSLVEPAIFLAGITGCLCQSQDGGNHWATYLNHNDSIQVGDQLLLCSLYEAQNPKLVSDYFAAKRVLVHIFFQFLTSYDCYALSYCLAHSSERFRFAIPIRNDSDISLVETFVKGLNDHCRYTTPKIKSIDVHFFHSLWKALTSACFGCQTPTFQQKLKRCFFNPPS